MSLAGSFREHLKKALFSPPQLPATLIRAPKISQLNVFAYEKWNSALYFMAGLEGAHSPSDAVVQVLVDTGLMTLYARNGIKIF